MAESSSEFATEPVPEARTVGWFKVSLVAALVAFSLPNFVAGMEVARAANPKSALLAILFGNLLLTIIGAFCGAIGSRTRLSSYMLTRIAFGTYGAMLVNLAFAVSLLGWFGVNIDLFSDAVSRLLTDVFNTSMPNWVIEVGAGIVMTTTTIFGFRAINTLSMFLVPVLVVVTIMLISQALGAGPVMDVFASQSEGELAFGTAMSSVVGGIIIGAIILPDITRFIRHWSGAIYTAILSYMVIGCIVQCTGALAALVFDGEEFLDIMIVIGLSWAAFAIVIAGSWVLNSLNLYSAGLSVEATLPNARHRTLTIALGALGTVAAFMNILDSFLTFLFYLSIVFAPVAGVIIVDYLLLRRDAYHDGRLAMQRDVFVPALSAWVIGAVVALLGSEDVLTISGIAAVDAIVVAGVAHFVFSRLIGQNQRTERTA